MRSFLKSAAVVSMALMLLLASSCQTTSNRKNQIESLIKLGESHLYSGNTQSAFVKFHEALQLAPHDKRVLNNLGSVHLNLREFEKAEEYLKKAIAEDDTFSEAYNTLCFVYYNTGRYEEGLAACRKAIENPLYPTPEKSYYNMGRIYHKTGNYPEAVKSFGEGVKRYPNFFQAYYAQALSYNANKQFPEAAKAMGLAIGLDPRFQGDKQLAENKFRSLRKKGGQDSQELDQLIEILHY